MLPTPKSPGLRELLNIMTNRENCITKDVCVSPPFGCGGPATYFRDEKSRKEYAISGLCQICQDSVFGKD